MHRAPSGVHEYRKIEENCDISLIKIYTAGLFPISIEFKSALGLLLGISISRFDAHFLQTSPYLKQSLFTEATVCRLIFDDMHLN